MADSLVVEGIKLVGGFLGIATTIFTIWDRLFRDRPWMRLHVDPTGSTSDVRADPRDYTEVVLEFHNPSRKAIIIKKIQSDIGDDFRIMIYPSVYGVIAYELSEEPQAVVYPGETRKFDVHYDRDLERKLNSERFSVRLDWSYIGSMMPSRTLRASASIKQLNDWRQDTFLLAQAIHEQSGGRVDVSRGRAGSRDVAAN